MEECIKNEKTDQQNTVDSCVYNSNYYLHAFSGDSANYLKRVKAITYREKEMHDSYVLELIRFAGLNQNKHAKILDVGCGRGELVFMLATLGFSVDGIDYSQDAITLTTRAYEIIPDEIKKRVMVTYLNAKEMSFENKYDVIIMEDFVEHLYDWELIKVFENAYRALKVDGRLIIFTKPNKNWIRYAYPIKRFFAIPKTLIKKIFFQKNINELSEYERKEHYRKTWRAIRTLDEPFLVKVARFLELFYQRDCFNYACEKHVNETTPRHLKKLLKKSFLNVRVWCGDQSRNLFSMLTKSFWGSYIWAIAVKGEDNGKE